MRVDEFDYHLPAELIAQEPLADRSGSRMLVVDRSSGTWQDRMFREFPQFIRPGDCLVLNDSRVIPSRLYARRGSGTAVIEVFLLRALSADQLIWRVLVRPGKRAPVGERLIFDAGIEAEVLERFDHGERTVRFRGTGDLLGDIERIGHVPLPPYIKRPDRVSDRERYQTVFAREKGSVAAPTAGLHFTPEILQACAERGAAIARVTLHVGLGTFAPLRSEHVEENELHSERYSMDAAAVEAVRSAARRVAVGTTSVRTLETMLATGRTEGETSIFIYPGYCFRGTDAMLTNFHLPRSSLVMLLAALAGRKLLLAAYEHAVKERYRFFSYGDCMLVI
jgi:S-adenosylmethionine:tRNA ribosyltransferase-isomerase